jgi:hypothetical protein
MDLHGQAGVDMNLNVLIRHLVLSFPQAAILSRSVGDRYHVYVIVPYDGGPEKAVQVERAMYDEAARSIKDLEECLSQLNLPTLFRTRARYEMKLASPPRREHASGDPAVDGRVIRERSSTSPANEGWPPAPIGGTLFHGPLHLSSPSLPTSPGPLFAVCSD